MLIPGAPLGVITTAVQALAGVLLPSATVFLLLLCNDRAVLGPWRNPGWLNVLATVIVARARAALADPDGDDGLPEDRRDRVRADRRRRVRGRRCSASARGRCAAAAARGAVTVIDEAPTRAQVAVDDAAADLPRAGGLVDAGARRAMLAMRGYLVVSVVLLVVKAAQLGGA